MNRVKEESRCKSGRRGREQGEMEVMIPLLEEQQQRQKNESTHYHLKSVCWYTVRLFTTSTAALTTAKQAALCPARSPQQQGASWPGRCLCLSGCQVQRQQPRRWCHWSRFPRTRLCWNWLLLLQLAGTEAWGTTEVSAARCLCTEWECVDVCVCERNCDVDSH